ncbi:hypothetical protein RBG61_11235 [Paludicola sp. MB14-C6]|uniref:hypothetical protein n=1 Tax=Paludihabitans sp. MB14-C6 TaxID=3070656 RepID=UPI0027DDFFBA|nr:hypothetical protein [Paludicola sp. MB14-C6]WMJ22558.1 hypothetical protein RBG61_11235 [Paludicola sp. MB14-C6]
MTTSKIKLFRNLSFGALLLVAITAIIHITISIIDFFNCTITSFTWYDIIFLTGIRYVLPILILLCLTIVFSVILKKHKK